MHQEQNDSHLKFSKPINVNEKADKLINDGVDLEKRVEENKQRKWRERESASNDINGGNNSSKTGDTFSNLYAVAPDMLKYINGKTVAEKVSDIIRPHTTLNGKRYSGDSVISKLGEEGAFDYINSLLEDATDEKGFRKEENHVVPAGISDGIASQKKRINLDDLWGEARRKFVDSGDTIQKIAKIVKDDTLYPLFNNAKQAGQSAMYDIGVAQTDIKGSKVGKSVNEIFSAPKGKDGKY